MVIKKYTGDMYKPMNAASTSKDIVILKLIRYLFQILIKNHREKLVGMPVISHKTLYRKISLPG